MILQARMGSSRLPGKSMMPLAGQPLVGRILERVLRCLSLDTVVVATTDLEADGCLVDLADSWGAESFQGDENDLVGRYLAAAEFFAADVIVRLPADNPVPEPQQIDRIVEAHLKNRGGFHSNLAEVFGSGFPDGIGAEVFDTASLKLAAERNHEADYREHVHLNFFDYESQEAADPESFPVSTIECPVEIRRPELILDVNTREDYLFMSRLYDDLYPRDPEFGIVDIIDWYDDVWAPEKRM